MGTSNVSQYIVLNDEGTIYGSNLTLHNAVLLVEAISADGGIGEGVMIGIRKMKC
jgi:hypothetical protein